MSMLLRLGALIAAALFLSIPATASAQDCDPRSKRCVVQQDQGEPEEQTQETDCDPVNNRALCDTQEEQIMLCEPRRTGEQCGRGNFRQTPGGGNTGNVSHKGWPKISGILWKVTMQRGTHRKEGGPLNDELLGHHGNDTVIGYEGKDVLWGDWELKGNGTNQSDVLRGGDGNDFLYPSHGKNMMYGGDGNDRIIAYYGHGLIDCGKGPRDYAQTRWQRNDYKVRGCEHIRHFCAFGSKPNGDCKKPGEDAYAVLSRQASQSSLLARLDLW